MIKSIYHIKRISTYRNYQSLYTLLIEKFHYLYSEHPPQEAKTSNIILILSVDHRLCPLYSLISESH